MIKNDNGKIEIVRDLWELSLRTKDKSIDLLTSEMDKLYEEFGFKNGFVPVDILTSYHSDSNTIVDPLHRLITESKHPTDKEIENAIKDLKQLILKEIDLEKLSAFLKE